jgi:hypothetical protein
MVVLCRVCDLIITVLFNKDFISGLSGNTNNLQDDTQFLLRQDFLLLNLKKIQFSFEF